MESPIPQLAKPSAETQRYCDLIYVGIFAILGLVFFVKGVGMIGQEVWMLFVFFFEFENFLISRLLIFIIFNAT